MWMLVFTWMNFLCWCYFKESKYIILCIYFIIFVFMNQNLYYNCNFSFLLSNKFHVRIISTIRFTQLLSYLITKSSNILEATITKILKCVRHILIAIAFVCSQFYCSIFNVVIFSYSINWKGGYELLMF